MPKTLITVGIILVIAGLVGLLFPNMGLGKLPGDILIEKGNFKCYVPITTSLILSAILSLLLWLLKKL